MQEKLWTKDFILIMIINFFVFLNHLMILSTFPFYIESLHGSEAVAGLAAAAFPWWRCLSVLLSVGCWTTVSAALFWRLV